MPHRFRCPFAFCVRNLPTSIATNLAVLWMLTIVVTACTAAVQEETPEFSAKQIEHFEKKVRPILAEHCFECHGPEASPLEGGLSVASRKSLLHGGDTGPAIIPGQAFESLLVESIKYDGDYEMPPDTRMSDQKIKIIVDWINDGAPWPKSDDREHIAAKAFDLTARKAAHWAWKPVFAKRPPKVDSNWPSDAIDQFVFKQLQEAELTPASPADKRTLIRRAYFDFIGLPPTAQQVQAFIEDKSDNAFEKVIDQLLASPHFGERWARHWMDLVRYAETYGHEFDYEIPYPHQYRDYLIRAFNEDVSYKQFIEEHIAGDLLPQPRRHKTLDYNESVLGTGFWFFGEAKHGAVDSRGEEAATFDNQIDVMTKTFQGLTVACARCHDHKFDAITATDYYALYGFLKSSRRERLMLDPGHKIEAALEASVAPLKMADAAAKRMSDQFSILNRQRLEKYLETAVKAAPDFINRLRPVTIQGESLSTLGKPNGTVETQRIAAKAGFAWQGDQQIWWRDGKEGDVWKLTFAIPGDATDKQAFDIQFVATVAPDYGRAEFYLGDSQKPVATEDFYASRLGTKSIDLKAITLTPGENTLRVKLLSPNPKAVARNMIGLDAILITPVAKKQPSPLTEFAEQHQLRPQTLEALVKELASDGAKQPRHPLYQARLLVDAAKRVDQWTPADNQKNTKKLISQHARQQAFFDQSKLFADFDQGMPKHWRRSGFAFSEPADQLRASLSRAPLQPQGTISSGRNGKAFFGLLRSPSFIIENEKIHYRVRGRNVTVRLIIDSFFMDEYNALLYRDCKKTLPDADRFTWVTQAGDIKNYIGHRAYLEVIDHGDGFVEIDQIRFSSKDAPSPIPVLPFLNDAKGAGVAATIDRFETLLSRDALSRGDELAATELTCWLIDKKLVDMAFGGTQQINTRHESAARFVSTSMPSTITPVGSSIAFSAALAEAKTSVKAVPAPMMALGMADGNGEDERVFIRGNHNTLGDVVPRRYLSAISKSALDPQDSSGRFKLARKITAPNNPLTSRVAVNRLWHHMMGRGIVESVDNFGVLGKAPSHPKLLDYLASEFQQDGWSIKRMLKRIALTKTYQMSSQVNYDANQVDPENRLLHRANIKRLQGEAIRDSLMAVSGRLDKTMFGPSVPVYLTPFMSGRGRPGRSGPLDGNGRRSVYLAVRRNFLSPMMLAFDTPAPFNAMGKRNQSNVPSQALIMMNSPLVLQQSRIWAKQIVTMDLSIQEKINHAFATAFARPPSQDELESSLQFLKQQATELKLNESELPSHVDVWTDFCHVLFNTKEFIYIQ